MQSDGWKGLVLAAATVWVLGCGSACADGSDVPEGASAPALHAPEARPASGNGDVARVPVDDRGLAASTGDAPAGGSEPGAPAGADEPSEADRARGEQVAKTIGKVVLFILLVPLSLLAGGGSIGFR